jgi:hypothetical protein
LDQLSAGLPINQIILAQKSQFQAAGSHQSVTAKGLIPVPVSAEWFLNRVTEMWYYKTHSD